MTPPRAHLRNNSYPSAPQGKWLFIQIRRLVSRKAHGSISGPCTSGYRRMTARLDDSGVPRRHVKDWGKPEDIKVPAVPVGGFTRSSMLNNPMKAVDRSRFKAASELGLGRVGQSQCFGTTLWPACGRHGRAERAFFFIDVRRETPFGSMSGASPEVHRSSPTRGMLPR